MKIKGSIYVGIFLVLLIVGFCREARSEVSIEAGGTWLSGDFADGGMLLMHERFGKYSFGIGYVSEQFVSTPCGSRRCDFDIRENILIQAQRELSITDRCRLGIGPAFFQNTNRALGKRFTIGLMAGCETRGGWGIALRHYSNAGSGTPNLGQDAILITYRFK